MSLQNSILTQECFRWFRMILTCWPRGTVASLNRPPASPPTTMSSCLTMVTMVVTAMVIMSLSRWCLVPCSCLKPPSLSPQGDRFKSEGTVLTRPIHTEKEENGESIISSLKWGFDSCYNRHCFRFLRNMYFTWKLVPSQLAFQCLPPNREVPSLSPEQTHLRCFSLDLFRCTSILTTGSSE